MLKINRIFKQLRRTVVMVMLASLILLTTSPVNPAQAASNNSSPEDKMGRNANVTPNTTGDDYFESGKRAAEVIPKELGTGSRQKNPVEMLKRAGEELGNNPLKRTIGDNDYDRSEIEQELARNKAARGDFGK